MKLYVWLSVQRKEDYLTEQKGEVGGEEKDRPKSHWALFNINADLAAVE